MAFYLKIDVSAGRFLMMGEDTENSTNVVLTDIENPGDLSSSITSNKLTISSATTGLDYLKDFIGTSNIKLREIGSSTWNVVQLSNLGQSLQTVLDRPTAVVISDDAYNLSDFVKPDLTSGHSETTEFVHNGDVDNGGAVILNSNSALIGFQSGTFVKTTENIVQGRPYGRVQIKVDNGEGTGTAVDAIDILQGNVVQYPTITVSGEAVFAEDVEFQDAVILTSPNGTKYRLGVDNSGNLSTQAV